MPSSGCCLTSPVAQVCSSFVARTGKVLLYFLGALLALENLGYHVFTLIYGFGLGGVRLCGVRMCLPARVRVSAAAYTRVPQTAIVA